MAKNVVISSSASIRRRNDEIAVLLDRKAGSVADKPLVTVITPAFNVQQYIGEAVHSVLNQTYGNFEYIVVDDGSTDSTAKLAEQAAAGDSRVKVVRDEHAGGSAARNAGLAAANGELIAFLDGDDRWHPTFLEENVAMLLSMPPDVGAVFCRPRVISETGRPYLVRWEQAGGYDFDGMLAGACPPKCGSSLVIRKAAFDQAGNFSTELKSAVDLDMWLRIQKHSEFKVFWGNPAYLIDLRVRSGAISRDHNSRFEALDALLAKYTPEMERLPRGVAYVRPAVFAFRSGAEDFALRWTAEARKAGLRHLVTDVYGLRMLIWAAIGSGGRARLRSLGDAIRRVAGRALGAKSAIER